MRQHFCILGIAIQDVLSQFQLRASNVYTLPPISLQICGDWGAAAPSPIRHCLFATTKLL